MSAPGPFSPERVPSRWELIRDALVFQGKLLLDGLRDLTIAPVSLVAALFDLLGIGRNAGLHFYEVVDVGRRSEEWIDLFAAADHVRLAPPDRKRGVDEVVGRLERILAAEVERGGLTASAMEAVDRALDRARREESSGPDSPPGPGAS